MPDATADLNVTVDGSVVRISYRLTNDSDQPLLVVDHVPAYDDYGRLSQSADELTVPLPLTRNHPYGDDIGYGPIEVPDPVREVVFCLGVIEPPFGPSLALTIEDGLTTIAHGNAASDAQYLFCSSPSELPDT